VFSSGKGPKAIYNVEAGKSDLEMNYHARCFVILGFALLLLSGCSNPLSANRKKLPFSGNQPVINTMEPEGPDAGCWFYRRDMAEHGPSILNYHDSNHIQMNINKKIINFKEAPKLSTPQAWKFQAGTISALIELGPEIRVESICGVLTSYPKAQITVMDGSLKTLVPVKGYCGCS
jgi:hypothetical protein